MSRKKGVISVFVDPIYHLHTTRSWDFLQLQNSIETSSPSKSIKAEATSSSIGGEDTIIGLLDTGIKTIMHKKIDGITYLFILKMS